MNTEATSKDSLTVQTESKYRNPLTWEPWTLDQAALTAPVNIDAFGAATANPGFDRVV